MVAPPRPAPPAQCTVQPVRPKASLKAPSGQGRAVRAVLSRLERLGEELQLAALANWSPYSNENSYGIHGNVMMRVINIHCGAGGAAGGEAERQEGGGRGKDIAGEGKGR